MASSSLFAPSKFSRASSLLKLHFPQRTRPPGGQGGKGRFPFALPVRPRLLSLSTTSSALDVREMELTVLGIETSCDDTAAAVVSFDFLHYWEY